MSRRGRRSDWKLWSLIGGGIAGGAALLPLIPAARRRAMRVTTILKKDHRMVSGLITTLQMTPRVNGMVRSSLFDQIRQSLLIHMQAEEEILYPAMRNFMFTGGEWKVDEAYREQQQIRDLLNELSRMNAAGDTFETKLADLKNKIHHHVEQEEGEMFMMLKDRVPTEQQEEIGRRIHERKVDLKRQRAA
jgi:hemerythrin superfamily protein